MSYKQDQGTHDHLDYLDSVRGIAAIMVMVYHFINWKYESHIEAKLGSIIFNGSDAVSFFFVLSGFVLSYKYVVLRHSLDIGKFYVNRIFRLWPAFFITILLNALNWNRNDLGIHNLVNIFILNRAHFWEEALLLFKAHPMFYTPGWTLVIELAISLFVPFMIVLANKDKRIIYWLLFIFLLIGVNMGDWYMFHFHFALGVLLSCLFVQINSPEFKASKWYKFRYLILGISFVFYSIRHIDRIMPFGEVYNDFAKYTGVNFFHYTAIASFVFIAAILCSKKAQTILNHKFLQFFGKISYGIYLMHWLLVTDVFIYWDNLTAFFPGKKTAFAVIFTGYFIATILLATVLHYAIELPFIKLGKRIANRMKPSLQIK